MFKGFEILNLAYNFSCFRVVLGSGDEQSMHGYVLKLKKLTAA